MHLYLGAGPRGVDLGPPAIHLAWPKAGTGSPGPHGGGTPLPSSPAGRYWPVGYGIGAVPWANAWLRKAMASTPGG